MVAGLLVLAGGALLVWALSRGDDLPGSGPWAIDDLHKVVAKATSLRVCTSTGWGEGTVVQTIADPSEVERVKAMIVFDRPESSCKCGLNRHLEFWRGDRLLAAIGVHHGHKLRGCEGVLGGDMGLTDASADALCRWLADHGCPGPLELRSGEKRTP
jgi:hypothetical protein